MFDGFLNADTNIFVLIGALIVGFIVIIWGGDKFVDSAIWMAVKTKMPKMLIGATIVSIGTTLPEMFASFTAASGGDTAIAIGNSIGSIMCNTSMILAITLTFAVGAVNRREFLSKYVMLTTSIVLLLIFALSGYVALWQCLVLVAIGIIYFVYNIVGAVRDNKKNVGKVSLGNASEDAEYQQYMGKKGWWMITLFVLGTVGIAVGANLLVSSVKGMCTQWGVDEGVIALTVVAIGTSLPELVTTLTSLRKSSPELSLGNILGADVINATIIVGGSGLFTNGLTLLDKDFLTTIVTVIAILTVLMIIALPVLIKRRTYRWQGVSCFVIYLGYMAFLMTQLSV